MPDTGIHAAAVALGRKGGRSTSPRKRAASVANMRKVNAAKKAAQQQLEKVAEALCLTPAPVLFPRKQNQER